jgi:tetratricopeptide (TPR) repeat protein
MLIFGCPPLYGADRACDGRFSNIYPKPFLETTSGKATIIIGSAVIVAAITYATAGTGTAAGAGTVASWVGTRIGMLAGYQGIAATNFGLALFGGGSIANGGLGILGGITVLNSLGDLGLSIAFETLHSALPKNYEKYSAIQIKMPKQASREVLDILDKLEDMKEFFQKNGADYSFLAINTEKYYKDCLLAIAHSDPNSESYGYDLLVKTIIEYNLNDFERATVSLNQARPYFTENGVLDYIEALLWLTDGDFNQARALIQKAINEEPEAVIPYILLTQMLIDQEQYAEADRMAARGLDQSDSSDFTLLSMAGNINYNHLKQYDKARQYYSEALKEISINEYEAEMKFRIGKCYQKLGNYKKALDWKNDALSEVKDNPVYAKNLEETWNDPNF